MSESNVHQTNASRAAPQDTYAERIFFRRIHLTVRVPKKKFNLHSTLTFLFCIAVPSALPVLMLPPTYKNPQTIAAQQMIPSTLTRILRKMTPSKPP
jgi:hypothetical protein